MVGYVGSCLRSLAVLVSIAGSAPHSLDGAELAKLQATYQGQLEKLEAPARTLHSSYQRKLEETHAGAMNAGNEALAAAVAAALEEAKEKGIDGFYFVPDDGGEEPEALLRLKTPHCTRPLRGSSIAGTRSLSLGCGGIRLCGLGCTGSFW